MRNFYFLLSICLFSAFLSKAQDTNGYVSFCGQVYYEMKDSTTILHWKDTNKNALYYQIHVKMSWSDWAILDSVSGQDTSYILPIYSDSIRGEVYYLLAFYDSGVVAQSKKLYIVEIDTSISSLTTNSRSSGLGGRPSNGPEIFSYHLENSDVILAWDTVANGSTIQFFRIERNGKMIAELRPDVQTYRDDNLELGSYLYTLCVHYKNNNIDKYNLRVELYPATPTISYSWGNQNDLILDWILTTDGVQPTFFKITCNNEHIVEMPAQTGINHYTHTIFNPTIGTNKYRLFTSYTNEIITITEIIIEVEEYNQPTNPLPKYFVYNLQHENNITIVWIDTVLGSMQPSLFQIERNGTIIKTLESDKGLFLDANLDAGVYFYRLLVNVGNLSYFAIENPIMVTIDSIPSPVPYAFPENFIFYIENDNDVVLRWDIPYGEQHPLYYQIEKNGNTIGQVEDNVFIYFDLSLNPDIYEYRLLAKYNDGTQLVSKPLIVEEDMLIGHPPTTPSQDEAYVKMFIGDTSEMYFPPDNFAYTVVDSSVHLTWDTCVGIKPLYYQIERNGEIIAHVENANLYIDSPLEVGTYVYRISSVYAIGRIMYAINVLRASIIFCN